MDAPVTVPPGDLVRVTVLAEAHDNADHMVLVPQGAPANATPVASDLFNRPPDLPTLNGVPVYHAYFAVPPTGLWEARFLAGGTGIAMVTSARITGSAGSTSLPRLTLNGRDAGSTPLQVQAGASLAVAVTGGTLTVTDQVVLAQAPPGTLRLAWYLNGQTSPPTSVPPSVAFLITAPAQAGLYESQFVAATGGVVAGPAVAVSGSLAPTGPDDPFFFDTDGVGSVRQITQWPRSAATFVWQKDFQPFGLETGGNPGTPGGLADEVGFGGKEIDPSGLNYFGARYYSSFTGRFTRPDDSAFINPFNPQSMNLYAYVHNSPLRWVDPTGHEPQCPTDYCESMTVTAPRPPDIDMGVPPFLWRSLFQNPMQAQQRAQQQLPQSAALPMSVCSGSARVLKGNAATIGRSGGFSGPSAGNILVTEVGVAIIPRQWAPSRATLRPYLNQISGAFPSVGASFQGVVDIVGGEPPRGFPPGTNVQDALMSMFPGMLVLELPGASKDYDVTGVTLNVPSAIGCPAGTSGR